MTLALAPENSALIVKNGLSMETVDSFKCLGSLITATGHGANEIESNMSWT